MIDLGSLSWHTILFHLAIKYLILGDDNKLTGTVSEVVRWNLADLRERLGSGRK